MGVPARLIQSAVKPTACAAAASHAFAETNAIDANRAWEVDRALMLERSERRAWWVAIAGMVLGLIGIAAVFVQGPLRRVVEIPIVVDRVTGEATIQQRLAVETIPPMEALDKHNLANFVRAREGYFAALSEFGDQLVDVHAEHGALTAHAHHSL